MARARDQARGNRGLRAVLSARPAPKRRRVAREDVGHFNRHGRRFARLRYVPEDVCFKRPQPRRRSGNAATMAFTALDGLNFFLADVRGGLGPYVNVLLVTKAHWSPLAVGSVLMVSGLIGVAAHPAVGAFIDRTHAKRE